jgi:hypothetical protein
MSQDISEHPAWIPKGKVAESGKQTSSKTKNVIALKINSLFNHYCFNGDPLLLLVNIGRVYSVKVKIVVLYAVRMPE